jgi:hypothetical protein
MEKNKSMVIASNAITYTQNIFKTVVSELEKG